MDTRKGYVSVEFAVVALVFFLILLVFVSNFEATIPNEIHKIRSATSCFRAELLADSLLRFPGYATNWETNTSTLTQLGFATSDIGVLNYSKWVAAQDKTPLNVTVATLFNESVAIKYSSYVVKSDPGRYITPNVLDGPDVPTESVIIYFKDASTIGVYAREGLGLRTLIAEVEFFFPLATVLSTVTSFAGISLEGEDIVEYATVANGSTARVVFKLNGDQDQAQFKLSTPIDLLFIKKLNFRAAGTIYSQDYPIYYGLPDAGSSTESCETEDCPKYGTLLRDGYGTSGILDPSKNYCEIKRKMIMQNGTEKIGVDISIFAEG